MIETENMKVNDDSKKLERDKYKVIKPSKNDWLTIVIICLGFYVSWFFLIQFLAPSREVITLIISLISVSIVSVVTSLFLWRFVGKWTIKKIIVNTLRDHKKYNDTLMFKKEEEGEKRENKYSLRRRLVALLFGINLNDRVLYYIEEEAYTVNIASFKYMLRNKMFDLTSACLGVGFLIAAFAKIFIDDLAVGILAGSIVILASPILASWILPIFWTLRDARVKYLTPKLNIFDLSRRIRRSILNGFLGFSGLFAGIGFLYDVMYLNFFYGQAQLKFSQTLFLFFMAFVALVIIIILVLGTASLVTFIYLSKFHEKQVNDLRDELSKFLPKGITNVMFTKSSFV
jgi:hypothetical protein